jgi:transcriptional regulator GlxA family with amidase domain
MLAFPQAQILDIAGPLEVFARTARWLRDHRGQRVRAYETELVAPSAGPLETSGGLRLLVSRRYAQARPADTLLVSGGIGCDAALTDRNLLEWIAGQLPRVQRLGSICTGALLLARAGLLDDRAVTTHWGYCDRLARMAPRARVHPDAIYVQSGKVYTSAGVTAGMDLALSLVESDWGKAVAVAVAQELVLFLKRPGGQSQFSRHLDAQRHDDVFGELESWILEHLDSNLSVGKLARRVNMSERHFARRFSQRVGVSPGTYVRRVRVEEARRRIEEGAGRFKQLARSCGFADEQSLRRSFQRLIGVTPAAYRSRFSN